MTSLRVSLAPSTQIKPFSTKDITRNTAFDKMPWCERYELVAGSDRKRLDEYTAALKARVPNVAGALHAAFDPRVVADKRAALRMRGHVNAGVQAHASALTAVLFVRRIQTLFPAVIPKIFGTTRSTLPALTALIELNRDECVGGNIRNSRFGALTVGDPLTSDHTNEVGYVGFVVNSAHQFYSGVVNKAAQLVGAVLGLTLGNFYALGCAGLNARQQAHEVGTGGYLGDLGFIAGACGFILAAPFLFVGDSAAYLLKQAAGLVSSICIVVPSSALALVAGVCGGLLGLFGYGMNTDGYEAIISGREPPAAPSARDGESRNMDGWYTGRHRDEHGVDTDSSDAEESADEEIETSDRRHSMFASAR